MTESAISPTQAASNWLADFGSALDKSDIAAAVALFDDDCYWRDLVSFTWNIKTLESKAEIKAMLEATLARVRPGGWRIDGEASEAGGVVEAWFTFETAVARGRGLVRLKAGKCWTLLTTMTELKGFEEPKGDARSKGVEHGAYADRKTWLERRKQEEAELGYTTQPQVVIIGGGQGRPSSSRRTSGPAIPGASATSHCACTTRCGTTTCPTCRSPTTGRCFRRRTRSATGWRCTPR